jgi:DNA-binding MarR family transcriptional regulator
MANDGARGTALVLAPVREDGKATVLRAEPVGTVTHPALKLDDTVHQRVRLGILAVLEEAKRADFSYLRDALDLTDGNLSRHIQVLAEAGLVKVDKGFEGRRPRTWVSATKKGRAAFAEELRTLRDLMARLDGSSSSTR